MKTLENLEKSWATLRFCPLDYQAELGSEQKMTLTLRGLGSEQTKLRRVRWRGDSWSWYFSMDALPIVSASSADFPLPNQLNF
jgi:hypothetical protein